MRMSCVFLHEAYIFTYVYVTYMYVIIYTTMQFHISFKRSLKIKLGCKIEICITSNRHIFYSLL